MEEFDLQLDKWEQWLEEITPLTQNFQVALLKEGQGVTTTNAEFGNKITRNKNQDQRNTFKVSNGRLDATISMKPKDS